MVAVSDKPVSESINAYGIGVGLTSNPTSGVKLTSPVDGSYSHTPSPTTVYVVSTPTVLGSKSMITSLTAGVVPSGNSSFVKILILVESPISVAIGLISSSATGGS